MRLQAIGGFVIVLLVIPASVRAQNMVEHAAVVGPAAVGSATGALIGAKISSRLNTTAEAASEPEGGGRETKTTSITIVPAKGAGSVLAVKESRSAAPTPKGVKVVWRRGMERTLVAQPAAAAPPRQVSPRRAPAPQISRAELLRRVQSVNAGKDRADVIAKIGSPASTLAMADEHGRFVERMRFRADGEDVAVIEVWDGVVNSVATVAQP